MFGASELWWWGALANLSIWFDLIWLRPWTSWTKLYQWNSFDITVLIHSPRERLRVLLTGNYWAEADCLRFRPAANFPLPVCSCIRCSKAGRAILASPRARPPSRLVSPGYRCGPLPVVRPAVAAAVTGYPLFGRKGTSSRYTATMRVELIDLRALFTSVKNRRRRISYTYRLLCWQRVNRCSE